jgi:hypothetical protein
LANSANTTANNAWDKVKGLNEVSGLSDKTVTGYVDYRLGDITGTVKNYVDTHTPTITVTEGSDGNSYICTGGSCTGTPPGGTGWTKLNVDLSGINSILAGFGGTDEPQTVKGYIGNMGSYNNQYGNPVAYTVETKIGLNTNDTKNTTVKTYVDNWVGLLGKINDSTSATSVAAKLGTEITNADKTVAGYIQSKIDGISRDIQVEQVGNDTYICKTGNNCSTPVSDHPDQWAKITIDVSGYLTEDAADDLYAAKYVQTAVEDSSNGLSATYDLASSASTAAATAQGTADTANATANDAWNRVKNLGKDVNGDDYTTVAGRLGFGTDNNTKTVKQYIDDKVADVKPTIMTETYQGTTYICSSGNCTNHAPNTGWEELSVDLSALDDIEAILDGFGGEDEPEKVKQYVDNKFGNLGTYVNDNGQTRSYSVENKLGLPSDYANKTVTKYIVDRLGFTDDDANKTVAQYIAEHAASGGVQVQTVSGTTYICSENCDGVGTPPCADGTYPSTCGWQKLEVNLNGYATEQYVDDAIGTLGGDYTNVGDKINISSGTVKSYVDAVGNRIGDLGGLMVGSERKPYTVSEKLGLPAAYGDETVAKYIVDYVAEHAASGGVTVQTVTNDGVSETYICSKNCESDPPCQAGDTSDTCGWQMLEVNLSQYLKASVAEDTYLPKSNLKLVRVGADIHLKRVVGNDSTDYGIVAGVQDLMCRSYRTETVEPGHDGCPESGSVCYKMICNTNGND